MNGIGRSIRAITPTRAATVEEHLPNRETRRRLGIGG
jgi:hypothetical protein